MVHLNHLCLWDMVRDPPEHATAHPSDGSRVMGSSARQGGHSGVGWGQLGTLAALPYELGREMGFSHSTALCVLAVGMSW